MVKQIYNTRGMILAQLKAVLDSKKKHDRPFIDEWIETLKSKLDHGLHIRQMNDQQITYLEKFIARKEKAK